MKRGSSGLSLVVAVNKPSGMTSHDVVSRCRRIFDERRVGHTGTLDPLATGVLPICVGPATRLGIYLTSHDKRYRTTICLGCETDTDDSEGEPVAVADVDPELLEGDFAAPYIAGLVGKRMQVPPRYSAVKRNGKKAYELAREGGEVELEPRPVEVLESRLVERFADGGKVFWTVDFAVSKGTYIRALARDIGRELGCYGHVVALQRLRSGSIGLEDCVSLESLESLGEQASIDPVRTLGYRVAFADSDERRVLNGGRLDPEKILLYEPPSQSGERDRCACTGSLVESAGALYDGERISVVLANRLKGIYAFDGSSGSLKPECVFSTGVSRG